MKACCMKMTFYLSASFLRESVPQIWREPYVSLQKRKESRIDDKWTQAELSKWQLNEE